MKIDFVSDIACPWCAVGLNALEIALQRVGADIPVELHFQPFELNPQMGPQGEDAVAYLSAKYGISAEQIARMKRLGVQPSFLMNHVYFYGAAYRDTLFGPERAARADAAGDFVRAGMPFTLHTDAPCSNIGGLQLIQTAVTRKCSVDGSVIGPEQAISLDDALKAVTIHAAGQIGQANRIGTLERGKEADLTILESNPYSVDPNAIMDIKVSQTWVSGVAKFGA